MSQVPDSVPGGVARALQVLHGPNDTLTDFVRAYGEERGTHEWETGHGNRHRAELARAGALIDQARAIAAGNGWDWADVVELARQQMGLNEQWRTAEDQRRADLHREHRERLGREVAAREALRERQCGNG